MSVRSIKLKLMTNSVADSRDLCRGLWATHRMLNEGVAYYLYWLILLRQDAVKEENSERTLEDIKVELLKRIKEQQKRNRWDGKNADYNQILSVLRQLYELIVPSCVQKNGDAQSLARKFLSPLVDPDSQGGMGVSKAGRKPRWKKLREVGDPRWEEEYAKDQAKKATDPTSAILESLEGFGLKPLFPLFTNTLTNVNWLSLSKGQFVRNWDRDMFQQAIERLLSWESWNHRVLDERRKLENKINEYYDRYFAGEDDFLNRLQKYEQERAMQLERVTGNISDTYRISISSVRGWEKIYEKWLKKSYPTEKELWDVVSSVQQDMPDGFGDPQLYKFLTRTENRPIWSGGKERATLLKHYAIYNALQDKLERAKNQATFTWTDPIYHPLWLRLDARDGNFYTYLIKKEGTDCYVILDRLLWPNEDKWEERKKITVPIAPSQQIERKTRNGGAQYLDLLDNLKGKQQIIYRDYSSEIPFDGVLGGAKLQFERRHLEKFCDRLEEGKIGPVYLNVSIDLNPLQEIKNGRLQTPLGKVLKVYPTEYPKVVDFKDEELKEWAKKFIEKPNIGVNSLTEGFRVMSVDLGQRTSAAVSIFKVTRNKPPEDNKIYFEIANTGLYATHCRSLLLNLPGESPDRKVEEKRKERNEAFRAVRFQVRLLSQILRLHTKETREERLSEIKNILKSITDYQLWDNKLKEIWRQGFYILINKVNYSKDEWKKEIITVHRKMEAQVGVAVSKWRKSLRKVNKERRGLAGLSMWNVEELNQTRKLLISWSKRSRTPGEANRIGDEEKFGLHQLTHLQNLKDDRLKQMANLIVMTALGYKYDQKNNRWMEAYPACQVIMFEDLSRYRFKMDRPRRENSQLMKWAHRSIPRTVQMQGEIFGLQVGDMYSAFSSRFYAKTGAPGIRCRVLKAQELKDSFIKEKLIQDKFIKEEQWSRLQPGDIIPWRGGELFATLDPNDRNKIISIHADINAAQNLQRRFWMHRDELFRISCKRFVQNGEDICVPNYMTDRWKKLMGTGYFIKDNNRDKLEVYNWVKMAKIKVKTTPSEEVPDITDIEDIEDMEEIKQAIEEDLENRGEYVTLFRDCSGTFFPRNHWIPQTQFWSIVKSMIEKCMREVILTI
ncbi:MAG: type V CRISPR-associated protein Cas12b [Clostridia bacterium]|nr:type V CRISPR-associated protein Cas12b [Clostridia bacterium]